MIGNTLLSHVNILTWMKFFGLVTNLDRDFFAHRSLEFSRQNVLSVDRVPIDTFIAVKRKR